MITLPNNSYTITEIPEEVKVGKYSSIAADVLFLKSSDQHLCATNHKCVYTINWDQPDTHKYCEVGNDVWIGTKAIILNGVKIGDGAVIGAGAVVTKDVPPYAVVVGNPGKITRFRFNTDQMTALLNLRWWDKPPEQVEALKPFMQDVETFLLKAEEYK
jgi:chloramphenicol O-acetyltransferase type B